MDLAQTVANDFSPNQPPPVPNPSEQMDATTAANIPSLPLNTSRPLLEYSGSGFCEYQCIWVLVLLTIFVLMAIVFGALNWKH
jgi:hypothetical protein